MSDLSLQMLLQRGEASELFTLNPVDTHCPNLSYLWALLLHSPDSRQTVSNQAG